MGLFSSKKKATPTPPPPRPASRRGREPESARETVVHTDDAWATARDVVCLCQHVTPVVRITGWLGQTVNVQLDCGHITQFTFPRTARELRELR